MRVVAIVVAAGAGERFGARKQFVDLEGRCAAARAVEAARSVASHIVLVAPRDALGDAHGADVVVAGGATRAASVRAGLAALDASASVVIVHDAARPLATPTLFRAVVAALDDPEVDAAIPGLAVVDTIKRVRAEDGHVTETLVRDGLVAVQTPQAFRAATLRRAHEGAPEATDDAGLVEAIGGRVVVVQGEDANRKITTLEDLERARAALVRA
jgi:2-C-methyl-D-erythritol 4-phosphate cytidylyltransferase